MSTFEPPPTEPALNPYAAPDVEIGRPPVGPAGDLADAEATRRAYIGHEMSVKSLGSLHLLGAFFGILGTIGLIVMVASGSAPAGQGVLFSAVIAFYAVMTGVNLALGLGLRRLRNWARWVETSLLSLQLAAVLIGVIAGFATKEYGVAVGYAFGSLIVGYFLYLLLSSRARVVFSPGYGEVIARTPHIKYRTRVLLKVLVVIAVFVVIVAVVGAIIGARSG